MLAPETLNAAQRMTLQRLCEEHPNLDRDTVAEIYCGVVCGSTDMALEILKMSVETEGPVRRTGVRHVASATASIASKSTDTSRNQQQGGPSSDRASSAGPSTVEGASYEDLRSRSNYHRKKAEEEANKAQRYYKDPKTRGAATFASQESQKHIALMKKADEEACATVISEGEQRLPLNTIDLHRLHVDEARFALVGKLDQLDRAPTKREVGHPSKLIVITGYGKTSNREPVVRNHVEQWLRQKGYKYKRTNPGELEVTCK